MKKTGYTIPESYLCLNRRFCKCLFYGKAFLFVLLLLAFCSLANSQTYTSSGTYTVPAGVTSIIISVWGAGGGSGGAVAGAKYNASGGGGGGAFSQQAFAVTPGQVLTITVGTGGTAGGSLLGTSGGTGGASSVTGTAPTVSIIANGGGGGGGVVALSNGVAGTAGAAGTAGSGYCIAYAGGVGTVGVRSTSKGVGGAGGGGAGSGGAGGNGTTGTTGGGGTNSTGGAGAGTGTYSGGNGAGATVTTTNLAGVAGTAPGGGAAGAVASSTAEAGAQGGNGQVIIATLTVPSAPSALVLTPDITFITGSFTAPGTSPTGYLVIRTTSSTAPTTPAIGTTYTPGSSALGGFIVSNGATTNFTDDGLSASTQYWYWVYSYNGSGCSIVYSATSLNGNATTVAQPAYIYVHLKSINEENSTDFSFSMTGPSSYSKTFNLNDNALANNGTRNGTYNYFNVYDEGLSHGTGGDGQLWVIGGFFNLSAPTVPPISGPGTVGLVYYRNPGSSQWQQVTGITTAKYIDGAYANQFVYSNSSGNVIFYNNGTSTTIYTGGDAQDVSANGGQIAISTGTAIKVYSLSYFPSTNISASGTWTTLTTPGSASRLDINVTGTTIAYIAASGSNTVYTIPFAGGTATSLGTVGIGAGGYPDVAYDDNGVIYTSANNATYTDLIYHYSGGAWTADIPSRALSELTGGAGGLVYSVNLQAGAIQSIYSRQTDNSGNIYWIDDERVKNSSSLNGNGIMIPVTPGTYTLTETMPSSSYDLGRYNIYDPGGATTGNVSTQVVTFVVTAGEVVFAEYVNESLNPYSLSALTACNTTYYLQTFDASTSSPSRVTPAFGSATYGTPYSGTAFHYDSTVNPQDGYYSIVKIENSTDWFTNTATLTDHTGNGGYFLLVNASYSQDEFYRQRLNNLIVGGNYKVTYYAANINPAPPALITPIVKIGIQDNTGTVIASALSGSIPSPSNPANGTAAIWYPYTLSFTATSSSTDLFLTNANTGGYGNDLAIDDITIQLLPSSTATVSGISSCTTGVGTITVSSPTGSGYVYSDNNGSSYQSSATFSSLAASTYNVVTNYTGTPTGCTSTATPVVIIPSSSLYAMDNTGIVYTMTTAGAVTALNSSNAPSASTTADAVGYNPTNGFFYYFLKNASGAYTFNSYNPSLTTSSAYTTLASPAAGAGTFYIGGITADGNGYYAIDTKGYLYYYSISANTWTTVTTLIQDNTSPTPVNLTTQISGGEYYGDLTEDIYGDLWILISSATKYGLYEISAPIPTSSVASVTAIKAIPYTTTLPSTSWQGMAFDATGNLYISTSGASAKLYKIPIGSTTPSLVGTISPTTNNISDMTQCSFSNNPLSFVWSYFNASPQNNEVNIDWGVSQPLSIKGFYMERSSDGKNWNALAFVPYINGDFNYSYTDASPGAGNNYYRIAEADDDNDLHYSEIRIISLPVISSNISIWPNPATEVVHVQYNGRSNNLTAVIVDEFGRTVNKSVIYQGNNTIQIGNIPSGIYFLTLMGENNEAITRKIIKTKN